MEQRDTERPFSKEQERHLLRLAKKLFMEQHPNPQRIGCPGPRMLRAVAHASPDLSTAQHSAIMDHLSICSPCFQEFYRYRRAVRFRSQIPVVLGLAAVATIVGVLGYDYLARPETPSRPQQPIARQQPPAPVYVQASLDLRGHSPTRGQSPPRLPSELVLARGRLNLTIILPVGSEEGNYEVRLGKPGEEAALTAKGRARIMNYLTSLTVRMDTLDLSVGKYVLSIREEPWAWAEYSVELR